MDHPKSETKLVQLFINKSNMTSNNKSLKFYKAMFTYKQGLFIIIVVILNE